MIAENKKALTPVVSEATETIEGQKATVRTTLNIDGSRNVFSYFFRGFKMFYRNEVIPATKVQVETKA